MSLTTIWYPIILTRAKDGTCQYRQVCGSCSSIFRNVRVRHVYQHYTECYYQVQGKWKKYLQLLGDLPRSNLARYSIRTIRCEHWDSCVSLTGGKDDLSGLVASWYISKIVKIICDHSVYISNVWRWVGLSAEEILLGLICNMPVPVASRSKA